MTCDCGRDTAPGELTCPTCISKTRRDLTQIVELAALMPREAEAKGVNSEAAYLAGPAADPTTWTARKVYTARTLDVPLSTLEDDDPWHPYSVLGRWQMMLEEDYGLHALHKITIAGAAGFLDRMLYRVANDPEQDFALFAREVRECRAHLEGVVHDSRIPDLGAPCPECEAPAKRLRKEWAHWCADEDCRKPVHDPTGKEDRWVCQTDPEHWWSEADYRLRVADVYEENLDQALTLTATQMLDVHGVDPVLLRKWAERGQVVKRGRDEQGRQRYDVASTLRMRDRASVVTEAGDETSPASAM